MRPLKSISIMALLGLALVAMTAPAAYAAGTAAGNAITNQATLTFEVGNVLQPTIDSDNDGIPGNGLNPTSFLVDSKVDLSMTATSPTATGAGNVMVFVVQNDGNDTQRYRLQLYEDGADAFNLDSLAVYLDVNNDGAVDAGDTLLAFTASGNDIEVAGSPGTPFTTANVAADGTFQILVAGDVPSGQGSGDVANYTLKAFTYDVDGTTETTTASTGTNGVAVVLADGDAGAGVDGSSDGATNGNFLATGTFTVSAAGISVRKNVTPFWDPVNGNSSPKSIPGAYVQYEIIISNAAGSAAATLQTITDSLAGTLALDTDLITNAGPGNPESAGKAFRVLLTGTTRADNGTNLYFTAATGDDAIEHDGSATGGTITVDFAALLPAEAGYTNDGDLKAGESVTITFNAIIQ